MFRNREGRILSKKGLSTFIKILSAMCYSGLDPGTEKVHWWKNWRNPNKIWSLVNSNVQMLVSPV